MTKEPSKEQPKEAYTIYGRPGCGYCSGALSLLQRSGFAFEYIDVYEEGISKAELSEKIGRPVHTFPQILHGDTYVGGYTDLVPYLRSL